MPLFRKKPITIEAMQWTGDNWSEVRAFAAGSFESHAAAEGVYVLKIRTLEGTMEATIGDWIIRGVKGELYPCKPDVFEASYEPAPTGLASDGTDPRFDRAI